MSSQVYTDHQCLDARSLAMHCLVARKLLANPALIAQARGTLARWRSAGRNPTAISNRKRQPVRSGTAVAPIRSGSLK
jgi:hypothetical protein